MADDPADGIHLPGILYWAAPSGYGGLLPEYPPDLVVMHKTDNPTAGARGEAQYAHTRPSNDVGISSSHFYVDAAEVIGSVPLDYRAWAAHRFGNDRGWHVESCGMTGTFMTAADQRCVGLVRQLCALGNIPVRHLSTAEIQAGARGVVGHHDLVVATGQGSHTDPGWTAAQWEQFIAAVNGQEGGWLMALTDEQQEDLYRRVCNMDSFAYYGDVQGGDAIPPSQVRWGGGTPAPTEPVPYALMRKLNQVLEALKLGGMDPEAVRAIVREELDKTKLAG